MMGWIEEKRLAGLNGVLAVCALVSALLKQPASVSDPALRTSLEISSGIIATLGVAGLVSAVVLALHLRWGVPDRWARRVFVLASIAGTVSAALGTAFFLSSTRPGVVVPAVVLDTITFVTLLYHDLFLWLVVVLVLVGLFSGGVGAAVRAARTDDPSD